MTKEVILMLILFFSGLKNAAYYKQTTFYNVVCYLSTALTALGILYFGQILSKENWPYFIIPAFWVLAMILPFTKKRTDLVHAFENLWKIVFWIVAVLCGADVINLSLALVFGNIIFNIPIQWLGYGRLFSENKYELIQICDLTLNKKRVGLLVELVCGAALVANLFLKLGFTINDIVNF